MSPRAFTLRETLIGSLINGVISAGFYIAVFHGQAAPVVWGPGGLVVDSIPQGGVIGLMSVLVPTLLTRGALKAGKVQPIATTAPAPWNLAWRVVLGAIVGLMALTGGAALLALVTGATEVGFLTGLVLKVAAGALLPWMLTPIAIRTALSGPARPAAIAQEG